MSTLKLLSNKESALMGLLSEKEMYAYEINQEIEKRSMREWTELSLSSIYKLLRKMETQKLLTSTKVFSENNQTQKIYSITKKGLNLLKATLKFFISNPEQHNWRIDIASSNLNLLSTPEIIDGFTNYIAKLKERIECYKELEDYLKDAQCSDHAISLSIRPRYLLEAEINWVKDYINSLGLKLKNDKKEINNLK